MRSLSIIFFCFISWTSVFAGNNGGLLRDYSPTDPAIGYMGRIDFSQPALPRFWQPGVCVSFRFEGEECEVILNDEVLWGQSHNYIEVVIDGEASRMRLQHHTDTIRVKAIHRKASHIVTICKDTEANIGYLELAGIRASRLLPLAHPTRTMEFFGDSITCAASSDESEIPCGKGVWQDQHNAYFSYGAITARKLNARYHISAVSGIGLVHSCCNLDILMPAVYDKVSMRDNRINWEFSLYTPDVVTICLGQNDGIQDSALFCGAYIRFIDTLRLHYPSATIVCLTSPMADASLNTHLRKMLTSVTNEMNTRGDRNVSCYFFKKRYYNGCDTHPSLAEHAQIADELTAYIAKLKRW